MNGSNDTIFVPPESPLYTPPRAIPVENFVDNNWSRPSDASSNQVISIPYTHPIISTSCAEKGTEGKRIEMTKNIWDLSLHCQNGSISEGINYLIPICNTRINSRFSFCDS